MLQQAQQGDQQARIRAGHLLLPESGRHAARYDAWGDDAEVELYAQLQRTRAYGHNPKAAGDC